MNFFTTSIQKHRDANSQWSQDEEFNKGTKDYKITVKHLYDTNILSMHGIKVYPFALEPSKKLYHVKDDTIGGNGWVKATCGGEEVFDSWNGKEDNEAYYLKGTAEVIALSCKLSVPLNVPMYSSSSKAYYVAACVGSYGSLGIDISHPSDSALDIHHSLDFDTSSSARSYAYSFLTNYNYNNLLLLEILEHLRIVIQI